MVRTWKQEAYERIQPLECSYPMVWYYRQVVSTVRSLADKEECRVARMTLDQMRKIRTYINTDLHNYSIEFYLQRREWALRARAGDFKLRLVDSKDQEDPVPLAPSQDARRMINGAGFRKFLERKSYTYDDFLSETLPCFSAIHAHLACINRALGTLHYYAAELPFAEFTRVGKSEIRHLTRELERIMNGLLVATHLQPRTTWQEDLVSYLMSCRADCQRIFETIPRYFQSHRLRLVVFPIDPPIPENDPEHELGQIHDVPVPCLPWSTGVYMDMLGIFQTITQHVMAVIHWAVRMYSLWYFVPRRVLRWLSASTAWVS